MADPLKGPEMTYTAGIPEDAKGIRSALIALIGQGMNQGSTPYSGPMGSTADSGQLAAMNMLMKMSGNGKYTAPGTYSMPNQPRMWGSTNVTKTPIPGGPGGPGPGSPVPGNPGEKKTPGPMLPPGPGDDDGIYRPMPWVGDGKGGDGGMGGGRTLPNANARGIASILRLMQSRGMR